MTGLLSAFLALALLLVLAVFGAGIFSMVRGGDFALKYGNKLMRLRIIMQAAALLILVLLVLVLGK